MTAASLETPLENPSPGRDQPAWQLLRRYLAPLRGRVVLLAVLLLSGIALQLANPQVIRYFLDTAQSGGSQRLLLGAAAVYLGFALLQQLLSVATTYTSQRVSWQATNQLRSDLMLHCLRLDMSFHKSHTPGELIERIDGDVTELANFFSEFVIRVLGNGLLIAGILVLLWREDPRVGLALTLYAALTLFVLRAIQNLAVTRWAAARQVHAELYGFIEERVSGAEEIRAAGAEAYVLARLHRLMQRVTEKGRAAYLFATLIYNLTQLQFALGYAAGLALGVFLYLRGDASLGAAFLITYYVGMLAEPLQNLREQVESFQQALASTGRIQELLRLQPQVRSPAFSPHQEPARLPPGPLSVAFERVSFHYDDNDDVLSEIDFHIQPGRVVGVLGRTGSGKTTLTRLLFRLYDPAAGCIRLDGRDLRQLPLPALHAQVGMVTQDVQLFKASLRDNLTFFNRQISDRQLLHALAALHLEDWVLAMPDGLETRLQAGGQGLSAGEAQLLAFARVFLKDPGLVVLDEASSRLDPATEARLEGAIDRLFAGRTAVLIAHRLHTVQRADDILILEGGRVVEWGPRLALAADPSSRFARLMEIGMEEALA